MLHNEEENLSHSPSGAETFRDDSKYSLPDDREVVLCHSVISFSQHVLCAGIIKRNFFNEVRMLYLRHLCSLLVAKHILLPFSLLCILASGSKQ